LSSRDRAPTGSPNRAADRPGGPWRGACRGRRCRCRNRDNTPTSARFRCWPASPPNTRSGRARYRAIRRRNRRKWRGDESCGEDSSVARDCGINKLNAMPSEEELKAEIERLRAENENLKKPARGQLSLRVSEKGTLSVYGMGRFPVTLYREQWEK